jgi:EAL domain-containing protein (putative c-di-GMP-specific phosphodiesterase class I)
VKHAVIDADDAATISEVTAVGRRLMLRVVAEGVETREQLNLLKAQGCVEGQGHYFNRPMSAASLRALLEADVPVAPANDAIIRGPARRAI